MSTYSPPVAEIWFVIAELAGLDAVAALPGLEAASPDLVGAVLDEAGKFAGGCWRRSTGSATGRARGWRTAP